MATVKFYTRTNDPTKLAPVYLRLTDTGGVNLIVRTEFRMIPAYWNVKKQEVKDSIVDVQEEGENDDKKITFDDVQKWADEFAQLKKFILKEYRDRKTEVSAEWLTGVVDKFFNKAVPSNETLNQYIDRFIKEATEGKRLCKFRNTLKRYSPETLRSLRDFQNVFCNYQGIEIEKPKNKKRKEVVKEKRPYKPLNWDKIDIDFYNSFVQYFYDRNCSANYVGKHIKSMKAILRQAKEEGLPVNVDIEKRAFKAMSEGSDQIYLTEAEITKMYLLDLSDNKVLDVARDVFLCGCYTGQRYSDYSHIHKDQITEENGRKYIRFKQQKTGEVCVIPVKPELDEILKKYDYTLPKTWEQKINDNIKKVAAKAEIIDPISIAKSKGGKTVKSVVRKCDLVKTHTARRSACTNMFLAGIPSISIMKISGHVTETEFLKYIRVSKEETARSLADHDYFRSAPMRVAK